MSSAANVPRVSLTDGTRYVEAVREAIAEGIPPKMITKGSSGSYFARAKVEGRVQTVAYVSHSSFALDSPFIEWRAACSSRRMRSPTDV